MCWSLSGNYEHQCSNVHVQPGPSTAEAASSQLTCRWWSGRRGRWPADAGQWKVPIWGTMLEEKQRSAKWQRRKIPLGKHLVIMTTTEVEYFHWPKMTIKLGQEDKLWRTAGILFPISRLSSRARQHCCPWVLLLMYCQGKAVNAILQGALGKTPRADLLDSAYCVCGVCHTHVCKTHSSTQVSHIDLCLLPLPIPERNETFSIVI